MNTPNKLTMLRMVLVPVFVAILLWEGCPHRFLISGIVFGIAALTDLFDGKIARKHNLVTDFGKFMDPIADKLLVCAAYIAFVQLGYCSSWVLILILAREFAVTSMRLVAAGSGKVVAANLWGKAKTVSQMVAVGIVLLVQELLLLTWLPGWFPAAAVQSAAIWISVVLTVVSGVLYLRDNKKFVNPSK
ncbi:MAG: CDP-diacylglycerol--glycerol-3-phosphate 3-phosphatidyltransferase [Acutalibacteraceae bacterium]|jgi:CDP-diacylglycerol--glycerol-3-phosphate 3-phosphatidyltransferase